MGRSLWRVVVAAVVFGLGACASIPHGDPLQVTVAGVEGMPGEGLELRMMVKLRVQNPNDAPIDYDGVYVKLEVQDKTFASGVSDTRGTVPRFGESVIAVPVTVSMLSIARHFIGSLDSQPVDKIQFVLEGKLNGTGFRSLRFRSQGELPLPGSPATPAATTP